MKNPQKQMVRKTADTVISSVLASSILIHSCSPPILDDDLYVKYIPNSDIGDDLLPISIQLKPDDAKYIKALLALSHDIFYNPSIAKEVVNNPRILIKYGYDGTINLDDSIIKIVLALGNNEIQQAIKEKNMHKFVFLCKQNGILSVKMESDLLSDDFYQEQLEKIRLYSQKQSRVEDLKNHIIAVAGAVAIAVVAVLVIAGVGGVWNAVGAWNNFVKVNRAINSNIVEEFQKEVSVIDIIPIITPDGHQLISKYYEETVNTGVDFIREMYPEVLDIYSEEDIRQLLYVNILQYAK